MFSKKQLSLSVALLSISCVDAIDLESEAAIELESDASYGGFGRSPFSSSRSPFGSSQYSSPFSKPSFQDRMITEVVKEKEVEQKKADLNIP